MRILSLKQTAILATTTYITELQSDWIGSALTISKNTQSESPMTFRFFLHFKGNKKHYP